METKAAKRFSVRANTPVFKRHGYENQVDIARSHQVNNVVCKYWLEGRCSRNPCRFLHPNLAKPQPKKSHSICGANGRTDKSKFSWKNSTTQNSTKTPQTQKAQANISMSEMDDSEKPSIIKIPQNVIKSEVDDSINKMSTIDSEKLSTTKPPLNVSKSEVDDSINQSIKTIRQEVLKNDSDVNETETTIKTWKLCNDWVTGNCVNGEKCENLHSWFLGNGVSMVARLEGHTKAVKGIALPSGSNKLYCGSNDKTVRVWDYNNGHCGSIVDLGAECGTLVNEDPWIFAGLRNTIKCWNLEKQIEVTLKATGGQVNAITMYEDILFAGMEDGSVLCWKATSETSFSEVATPLKGHTGSVISLIIGAKLLFSGSTDHTIRVWDPESLQCMQVLNGHKGDVTALICWDSYLLSGSLDKNIKVWARAESGSIIEVFEHHEDDGVIVFCGIHDAEKKPILLCSCKDNSVRLYDLPSFYERGRMFLRGDVEAIQTGPTDGIFFTGDATGSVSVWKLHPEPMSESV